jgi:hypothetical protein
MPDSTEHTTDHTANPTAATCEHNLPQWKCLEMGCKAQHDHLLHTINRQSAEPATAENKNILDALYLLSIYYPEGTAFDCRAGAEVSVAELIVNRATRGTPL